jgi:hypothetical protein
MSLRPGGWLTATAAACRKGRGDQDSQQETERFSLDGPSFESMAPVLLELIRLQQLCVV